ncbi:Gfo/Idh/MocA family oxidoreductase [Clostridium sp.]|uniref:Gfo/Idh/MocA family protein n=1 Tax=Clostridium sp. TaxID=1506 RepID=UPI0026180F94|nr:Gfo/Idh/MocA family oxidoreductase [Clostridium sp.]
MINIGLIGTNMITERLIAGLLLVEGIKITAVYSRTLEKAKEFATKHNIESTFTDLDEMAKSNKIDAVYIASPNSLHGKQSKIFIKNKKHVLCEKAFASNAKEGKEVIDLARENNVVLMEAMKTTLLPNFLILRDNLHKIGKVRKYIGTYCQYSSRYDKYKAGEVLNAFKKELSNGALMDIGVYCLSPMVNLFGKPKKISGEGILLETGVDGEGSAVFSFDSMDASINYSKIADSHLPSEIQGEKGSIVIDKITTYNSVKIIYRDGKVEEIAKPQEEADMCYEVQEFVKVINSGEKESKINTLDNTLMVLEIMDEIRNQVGIVYPSDI